MSNQRIHEIEAFKLTDAFSMNLHITHAFQINDNGYILVSENGITFQYNFQTQTFTEFPIQFSLSSSSKVSFNTENNILYIGSNFGMKPLSKIDFQTESHKSMLDVPFDPKIDNSSDKNNPYIKSLVSVGNKLHLICNWRDMNIHYIWNENNQTYTPIHQFDELPLPFETENCALIYLQNRKLLIYISGDSGPMHLMFKDEHPYNLFECYVSLMDMNVNDSQWNGLNIKLPDKLFRYKHIITRNDQFVIFLAGKQLHGSGNLPRFSKCIYVLDVQNMRIGLSEVEIPYLGSVCFVVIENKYQFENLVVFGYFRDCCHLKGGEDEGYLAVPEVVMNIVKLYYCEDFIHLIFPWNKHEHAYKFTPLPPISINKILETTDYDFDVATVKRSDESFW
eukprot:496824_1